MIEVSRRPYAYGTSHRLHEVELERPDGTRVRRLLKDLGPAEKPDFLHDPRREIQAYRILGAAGLGTPTCHDSGDGWLMLEKIPGVELWQVGDLDTWIEVARWLARMHAHFAAAPPDSDGLLVYDANFLSLWPERAQRKHPILRPIAARYDRVLAVLGREPATFIHGEFYASNVLVQNRRIAPVDWEMAGIGPGVLDIAALVSGWDPAERAAIVAGYGEVSAEALTAARLHIAMQWLGWSPGWSPPPEHARDWLGEAVGAARDLGL